MLEYIDSQGVLLSKAELRAGLATGRVRVVLTGFEDSIVDESKKDDCDLNVLVKRWMRGEPVPQFEAPQFGDLSDVGSFQEMQERLLVVERAFGSLPAYVREHFGNSPVAFADAMVDPSRYSELVELGVLAPAVVPADAPSGELAGGSGGGMPPVDASGKEAVVPKKAEPA